MKIAYLTNCFGTQSHTFIRREVDALRHIGTDIQLYGIRQDPQIAPDATSFSSETQYLYPLKASKILQCNLSYLARSPNKYIRGFFSAFFGKEFTLKRRLKMLYHYMAATCIAKKMQQANITHIHAHFMNVSASIAMYAAHHNGIPYSITVHSAGTFKTPHILGTHQKLENAQFLAMISHYNIEYFDAITPCRAKSHVIRCGMDLNAFKYRKAELYQTHTPIRLLAVGRFVEKKGFTYLIEAASLLHQQGLDFTLTLIGNGPLEKDLHNKAQTLGIGTKVLFTGQQNTEYVHHAMSQTDIVLIPSVTSLSGEKEGLPVVIMEAMATGVPVIASNHSGISEIVQHGVTGLLTPEKDSKAIAQAIQELNAEPNQALIASAHTLIEETFNISIVAKKRLELFKHYHTEAL